LVLRAVDGAVTLPRAVRRARVLRDVLLLCGMRWLEHRMIRPSLRRRVIAGRSTGVWSGLVGNGCSVRLLRRGQPLHLG
jgi:hypothetical protein